MKANLIEINCQKPIFDQYFKQGDAVFQWSIGVPSCFCPSKSYFKITLEIQNAGSNQPTISDQLAFSDDVCGALFSNIHMTAGGAVLTNRLNYVPQISTLKKRLTKSSPWLKSIGETHGFESDFTKRCLDVSISNEIKDEIYKPVNNYAATVSVIPNPAVVSLDYTAMGFSDDHEWSWSQATKTITLQQGGSATLLPDLRNLDFKIGDLLLEVDGDFSTIVDITATTIVLSTDIFGVDKNFQEFTTETFTIQSKKKVQSSNLTGIDTNFQASDIGNKIIIDNLEYTIIEFNSATNVVITPSATIASTSDFYLTRKKTSRTNQGRNRKAFLWQPPIGLFDNDEIMFGSGNDYKLTLTPNPNYEKACIESLNTTGQIFVKDIKFYIYTMVHSIPDQITTYPIFECQTQSMIYQPSLNFTIPYNTSHITIFFQSKNANKSTLFPPSRLICDDNKDLELETLQVSYGFITKTATPWISDYTNTNNLFFQRYYDSLVESGRDIDLSGAETFEDYMSRGPYYHFSFKRDKDDRSSQLSVLSKFKRDMTDQLCFVVAWYSRVIQMTTKGGIIQSINTLTQSE